jgi:hypothetical protein
LVAPGHSAEYPLHVPAEMFAIAGYDVTKITGRRFRAVLNANGVLTELEMIDDVVRLPDAV